MKKGLVLSSGGALCLLQLGALHGCSVAYTSALEGEDQIPYPFERPDVIVASSAGGLIGYLLALGLSPLDVFTRAMASDLTARVQGQLSIVDFFQGRGLLDWNVVDQFLQECAAEATTETLTSASSAVSWSLLELWENTGVLLVLVVTDIARATPTYWSALTHPRVLARTAVRLTCSHPVLYGVADGAWLDGGVFDPFPILYARSQFPSVTRWLCAGYAESSPPAQFAQEAGSRNIMWYAQLLQWLHTAWSERELMDGIGRIEGGRGRELYRAVDGSLIVRADGAVVTMVIRCPTFGISSTSTSASRDQWLDWFATISSCMSAIRSLEDGSCTHENGSFVMIDGQTTCRHCGLVVPVEYLASEEDGARRMVDQQQFRPEWRNFGEGDSSRCYMRRQDRLRTVMGDVAHLVRDPLVLTKANELYYQVTQKDILRKSSRRGVIFACVFHAYKVHGQTRTPDELALLLDVRKKVVSKGLKYFYMQLSKTEDLIPMYITPFHFFPTLWRQIGLTFDGPVAQDLVDLFVSTHAKSGLLNRSNPQSVASAMVYYYLCRHQQHSMSCSKFASIVNLSVITISRLASDISRILGTSASIAIHP